MDVWTPNDDLLWSAKSVVPDVLVDNVRFDFGDLQLEGRDGLHMRRRA